MSSKIKKVDLLRNTSLSFEINLGQRDERAKFLARGKGYTAFFSPTKVILGIIKPTEKRDANNKFDNINHKEDKISSPENYEINVFGMKLEGCNPNAEIIGEEELLGKVNYFKGNDPSKWVTNISTYAKIRYKEIYPGIDLVYYGNKGQLEHDFIIKPGANPNDINLSFEGIEKLESDEEGNVQISIKDEQITLLKPKVYQDINGEKKEINCCYNIKHLKQVSFQVEKYDKEKSLIIDPVIIYSTYLGGSNDDRGRSITIDNSGNAYITGRTLSANFPLQNPYQSTFNGNWDAFVTKMTQDGSGLVYSTYLGGNSIDYGNDIVVDINGNAYIAGLTYSGNFPTTSGAYQTTRPGFVSAYITKLNANGNGLIYSTFLGGSLGGPYAATRGWGIAIDDTGNAYVSGQTWSTNFPTTSGAFQPTKAGTYWGDGFVTKLNANGSGLIYSTYLGGSNEDFAYSIDIDVNLNAYVTGLTESTNFPTTPSAFQPTHGGGTRDAFITKLNANGTALIYSTFLGGSSDDVASNIVVDHNGYAYVVGGTSSSDFPLEHPYQNTLKGGGDAFVTKLNQDGSGLIYSTYLGGNNIEVGDAIAVDNSGHAYITGRTQSTDFPLIEPFQDTLKGDSDAFVTKLYEDGSGLVYSSYLGGSNDDRGLSIAVDNNGNAYITGYTNSDDFPLENPYQDTRKGNYDAFVTKLKELTPEEKIQKIIEEIEELIAEGELNRGQGRALLIHLRLAIMFLNMTYLPERWRNRLAIILLKAFIRVVKAFSKVGILSPEDSERLIDMAQEVINDLENS